MFKTSLFLSFNSETSKEKILQMIGSQEVEEKTQGMRELISQMSQGKAYEGITHTVIKEILSVQSNGLRRLFYYFLEISQMGQGELLMLSNQIRKDLEHPNEFIRGAVLRYVSRLDSVEILQNFHKPILENFNHGISFVRRNAYFCLGSISKRLGIFEDTAEHLYQALLRDSDPSSLCQAFSSLFDLDKERAVEYGYAVRNGKGREVSLIMIEKIREREFLGHFLQDEDAVVRLEALVGLLEESNVNDGCINSIEEISSLNSTTWLIEALRENRLYIPVVLSKFKSPHLCIPLLDLLDSQDPSRSILEYVLANTQDYVPVLDILVQKSRKSVPLLSTISSFVSRYSVYTPGVVDLSLQDVDSDNPAVSYESLGLIKSLLPLLGEEKGKVVEYLQGILHKMRFGKILREILSILPTLDPSIFLEKNGAIWWEKENVFLVPYISIILTEKSRSKKKILLAVLVNFFKHVKEISPSSVATITTCIRRVCGGTSERDERLDDVNMNALNALPRVDVTAPLDCLQYRVDEKIPSLSKFLHSRDPSPSTVHQLTGLSDPIYVEASVIYSRFEILLDILFINQTDSYLQNMLFDFGSSPNLKPSYISTPDHMKPRTVVSGTLVFKVLDSSNGFVNGSVTFKESTSYTLNFSEIKTYVSDFLEPRTLSSSSFRDLWKKMEWENVYSVRLPSSSSLPGVFKMFQKKLKGSVVDCQDSGDFLVGNISSTTKQNNDIFFNVCMSKESSFINLECRVRSSKEDIVKSLNDILNEVVKVNKVVS